MSEEMRTGMLFSLGSIHYGRKATQPPREELRRFYRDAQSRLKHPTLWFDSAKRQVIGQAFGVVVASRRYTCFACAILSNHAHLIIRKHRDKAETMIVQFKEESSTGLRRLADVPDDHPVWSSDPYVKFLDSPAALQRTMQYVRNNPVKEGLQARTYPFIKQYASDWRGKCRQ